MGIICALQIIRSPPYEYIQYNKKYSFILQHKCTIKIKLRYTLAVRYQCLLPLK
jgi:hypothetical protein